jgi:hypothetical protein
MTTKQMTIEDFGVEIEEPTPRYSDGIRDGFIIAYFKKGKLYPMRVTTHQLELIDMILDELEILEDMPMFNGAKVTSR